MDINDLNKSQFLLLVLLVMIITSIATATVTVTLMDQSPKAGVVNTINRVVERVIPGATTTVVKIIREPVTETNEGEQIVKAMEAVSPAVIRLVKSTVTGQEILGTGFIVREGLIVTALKNLPTDLTGVTIVKGGTMWPGLIARDPDNNIAFVKFTATTSLSALKLNYVSADPVSGQTSVMLSYTDSGWPEIMTGLVMGVINANATSTNTQLTGVIRTGAVTNDNQGGPLLNTRGELLGVGLSRGYALSALTLQRLIDQIK